ncbi:MAG: hypothetical protein KGJ62_01845 [Armatimonadetes bacterium]|nr:hypothetical protein [Armatimonadota bacterium]MDE2205521.1 hypothetical protein [Armatimonadota bacterium]
MLIACHLGLIWGIFTLLDAAGYRSHGAVQDWYRHLIYLFIATFIAGLSITLWQFVGKASGQWFVIVGGSVGTAAVMAGYLWFVKRAQHPLAWLFHAFWCGPLLVVAAAIGVRFYAGSMGREGSSPSIFTLASIAFMLLAVEILCGLTTHWYALKFIEMRSRWMNAADGERRTAIDIKTAELVRQKVMTLVCGQLSDYATDGDGPSVAGHLRAIVEKEISTAGRMVSTGKLASEAVPAIVAEKVLAQFRARPHLFPDHRRALIDTYIKRFHPDCTPADRTALDTRVGPILDELATGSAPVSLEAARNRYLASNFKDLESERTVAAERRDRVQHDAQEIAAARVQARFDVLGDPLEIIEPRLRALANGVQSGSDDSLSLAKKLHEEYWIAHPLLPPGVAQKLLKEALAEWQIDQHLHLTADQAATCLQHLTDAGINGGSTRAVDYLTQPAQTVERLALKVGDVLGSHGTNPANPAAQPAAGPS